MVRYIAENEADYLAYQQHHDPKGYLVLIVNDRTNQTIPLYQVIKLGRDRNNTVVISDQKVSRNHATIAIHDDSSITIDDHGSSNGTYVNNILIKQPTSLQDKDRIRIGDTQFIFTLTKIELNQLVEMNVPPTISPHDSAHAQITATPAVAPKNSLLENPQVIWAAFGCVVIVTIILLIVLAFLLGVYLSSV